MIIFENPGLIDPISIQTFGVSVKEGENPIGFFGTGLKYAIAILLRHRQQIEILSGRNCYTFGTQIMEVRGKPFEVVTMNGQPLGFTTELGKTWELWQACRELYCNCIDERGQVHRSWGCSAAEEEKTIIAVSGSLFEAVFDNLHEFILQSAPIATQEHADIHANTAKAAFYRNMKVFEGDRHFLYTYNLKRNIDLTEDRTSRYNFQLFDGIRSALLNCNRIDIVKAALAAPEGYYEHELDFLGGFEAPSEVFLEATRQLLHESKLQNMSASRVLARHEINAQTRAEAVLTSAEVQMITNAIFLLGEAGYVISRERVKVYDFLGENVMGQAANGCILLSKLAFNMGQLQVTGTIYEEHLHLTHGFDDCSRGMQNYLLNKVIGLLETIHG